MFAYRLPAVKQRFNVKQDYTVNVLEWGQYNVYPQSQHEYMMSSGITTAAVKKLESFLVGDGFIDRTFGGTILNRHGQTANALLAKIAAQKAFMNTVCLHIGYNALLEVATIKVLPPQWYRLCKRGEHTGKYAMWNNWAGENSWHMENTAKDIKYLPAYNPDPVQVKEEIAEAGGWENYNGQMFVLNWEEYNHYSTSTFDSVLDDVITDAALANYRKNNVKSSFSASGILKYNALVESEGEREAILKEIAAYQGDEEAGNVVVIFPTEGEVETQSPIEFTPIQPQKIDDLYVNQEKSINERIINAYGQPRSLHPLFSEGGVFNQDQMVNSFLMYNGETKSGRNELGEVFELIIPFMEVYQPETYKIKPLTFGDTELGESKVTIETEV